MKITKATLSRINKYGKRGKYGDDSKCDERILVVADILNRAAVILVGEDGKYETNDGTDELVPLITFSDGEREFVSGTTNDIYEKRIIAGLSTKYQRLISGTFTHGNNGVNIYDVNRLVKAIVDEIA